MIELSLFTKSEYVVEQKRLAVGEDVYEIKDLDKNLICYVKRKKGEGELTAKYAGPAHLDHLIQQTSAAELWFETSDGRKFLTLSKGKGYRNVGFEIKDTEGKNLGSILMKKRIVGKPRYVLEDSEGEELAEVKSGLVVRHDYKIKNSNGKEVAKVHKKWLKMMKDSYAIEILDKSLDPTLILSLTIAIDLIEH